MKPVLAVSLLYSVGAFGQARFPMGYVDEVGHLGNRHSDEKRVSVDVGLARVRADDGELLVEGEMWSVNFDGNGRKDLLFAGYFPGSGRCV